MSFYRKRVSTKAIFYDKLQLISEGEATGFSNSNIQHIFVSVFVCKCARFFFSAFAFFSLSFFLYWFYYYFFRLIYSCTVSWTYTKKVLVNEKKNKKRDAWKIKTTLNHTQATNAAFWRWIYIGSVHRIGPSAAMQYTHAIVWTETNIFFATQIHLFLVSSDIYTLYMCYIYRFCLSVSSYRLLILRRSNERSKSRIQQLNSQKITSCSMPRAWSTLPFDQQFFFFVSLPPIQISCKYSLLYFLYIYI